MKPTRHIIVAGMTLTLAFGMTPAAALAAENSDSEVVGESSNADAGANESSDDSAEAAAATADSSEELESVEAPDDYDKEDFYAEEPAVLMARSYAMPLSSSFTPVSVSDEMKYFSKWESHSNYDQGLSAGDGYHAMGYYQFDNRYGLDDFLTACYEYDPDTYSMFAWVSGTNITGELYNSKTGTLTSVGQKLEDSWHAAYKADPSGFSALQDSWAYQQYYVPAERYLKSIGIDISERADCVKGLVWGMTNLFGTGGWKKFVGGTTSGYDWNGVWHDSYAWPGAWNGDYKKANAMSDREFVTTLCDYVVNNVAVFYKAQPEYHQGWQNRYRDEKKICLSYIAEDEAQQSDSLTYNANGGTGEMSATEGTVSKGVTVSACTFKRDGYEFAGWNTKKDGSGKAYAAGSTYTLTSGDDVLYAQWTKVETPAAPSIPEGSDDAGPDGGSAGNGGSAGGGADSPSDEGSDSASDDASGDGSVGDDAPADENGGSTGPGNNDDATEGDSGESDSDAGMNGEDDSTADEGNSGSGGSMRPSVPAPPAGNGLGDQAGGDSAGGDSATEDEVSDEGVSAEGDGGAESESKTDTGTDPSSDNNQDDKGNGSAGQKVENKDESNDGNGSATGAKSVDDSDDQDSAAKSDDEGKEKILKTNDDAVGIVAALVGGFALAFGVAAGTLRRILGRN